MTSFKQVRFSALLVITLIVLPIISIPQTRDPVLTMMTVTVTDRRGNYVTDLTSEAFVVTDEKLVRSVKSFGKNGEPMSIGILVDTSSSMGLFEGRETPRAKIIGEAILQFLQLSNADNEYFLMAFDTGPHFLSDWTKGSTLLRRKIDLVQLKGNTALFDACFVAIEKMETGNRPKRSVILISDGLDNMSHHTFNELGRLLKASDLTLYAIGILSSEDVGSTLGMDGEGILADLADFTGGAAFFPKNRKQLDKNVEQIAVELRQQYRIGFEAEKGGPSNKWHKLKLTVVPPPNSPKELTKLTIRTRKGYYAN
jgi:VWFA-related protein